MGIKTNINTYETIIRCFSFLRSIPYTEFIDNINKKIQSYKTFINSVFSDYIEINIVSEITDLYSNSYHENKDYILRFLYVITKLTDKDLSCVVFSKINDSYSLERMIVEQELELSINNKFIFLIFDMSLSPMHINPIIFIKKEESTAEKLEITTQFNEIEDKVKTFLICNNVRGFTNNFFSQRNNYYGMKLRYLLELANIKILGQVVDEKNYVSHLVTEDSISLPVIRSIIISDLKIIKIRDIQFKKAMSILEKYRKKDRLNWLKPISFITHKKEIEYIEIGNKYLQECLFIPIKVEKIKENKLTKDKSISLRRVDYSINKSKAKLTEVTKFINNERFEKEDFILFSFHFSDVLTIKEKNYIIDTIDKKYDTNISQSVFKCDKLINMIKKIIDNNKDFWKLTNNKQSLTNYEKNNRRSLCSECTKIECNTNHCVFIKGKCVYSMFLRNKDKYISKMAYKLINNYMYRSEVLNINDRSISRTVDMNKLKIRDNEIVQYIDTQIKKKREQKQKLIQMPSQILHDKKTLYIHYINDMGIKLLNMTVIFSLVWELLNIMSDEKKFIYISREFNYTTYLKILSSLSGTTKTIVDYIEKVSEKLNINIELYYLNQNKKLVLKNKTKNKTENVIMMGYNDDVSNIASIQNIFCLINKN